MTIANLYLARFAALISLATLFVPVSARAAGDTRPIINAVYPPAAFARADILTNSTYWVGNANKLLHLQTHFGAIGDGNPASAATNTAAFRAMFDFIKQRQ